MTEAEIMSLLNQIAASPELAWRFADIVYGQLNRSTVAPALDGEDLLKTLGTSGKNFREFLDQP